MSAASRSRRAPRRRDRASRRSGCAAASPPVQVSRNSISALATELDRLGGQARLGGPRRQLGIRHAGVAGLTGTVQTCAGQALEGAEIAALVLGVEHAGRSGTAAAGCVPPARPSLRRRPRRRRDCGRRRARFRRRAAPARPACPGSAAACRPGQSTVVIASSAARWRCSKPAALHRRDRRRRIGELVAARQARRRQVEQAVARPDRSGGRSPPRR